MPTSRPVGYYRGKVAALKESWGGLCVMCGAGWSFKANRGPEFAHLPGKPTALVGPGRGRAERYHDVKNNPGSYVLLCVECHAELDGRGGRERGKLKGGSRHDGYGQGGAQAARDQARGEAGEGSPVG